MPLFKDSEVGVVYGNVIVFNEKLNTKKIHSNGILENVCHAIKIALDLKINKKVIERTIPSMSFEGRFQ